MPQAGPPVVDFIAYTRRDQVRASGNEGRERVRRAGCGSPRSCTSRLAGGNESVACVYDAQGETLSVGRVQTPTLAMLVERELKIREFVPEAYIEVVGTFGATPYTGTWFKPGESPSSESKRLAPDGQDARTIVDRVKLAGTGRIESMGAGETSDAASAALRSHRVTAAR